MPITLLREPAGARAYVEAGLALRDSKARNSVFSASADKPEKIGKELARVL